MCVTITIDIIINIKWRVFTFFFYPCFNLIIKNMFKCSENYTQQTTYFILNDITSNIKQWYVLNGELSPSLTARTSNGVEPTKKYRDIPAQLVLFLPSNLSTQESIKWCCGILLLLECFFFYLKNIQSLNQLYKHKCLAKRILNFFLVFSKCCLKVSYLYER